MTKRYIIGWHTMHAWCCWVVAVIFHAVGLNHIYPPTSPLNLHVSMFFPYVQFFIYFWNFCDLWRCDFSHLWPEPCWLSVMTNLTMHQCLTVCPCCKFAFKPFRPWWGRCAFIVSFFSFGCNVPWPCLVINLAVHLWSISSLDDVILGRPAILRLHFIWISA